MDVKLLDLQAQYLPLRNEIRVERRAHDREAGEPLLRVDLPDALGGERFYLTLPRAGGWCRAPLGLLLREEFEPVLTSSWVPVPPEGPWLEEKARAARGLPGGSSYAVRFGWPPNP